MDSTLTWLFVLLAGSALAVLAWGRVVRKGAQPASSARRQHIILGCICVLIVAVLIVGAAEEFPASKPSGGFNLLEVALFGAAFAWLSFSSASRESPAGGRPVGLATKGAGSLFFAVLLLLVLPLLRLEMRSHPTGLSWLVAVVGVVGALIARANFASANREPGRWGRILGLATIVTRAARFHQPPEALWQAITDYGNFPTWRRDLKSVTPLPPREGRPRWREYKNGGDAPRPSWWVEIEEMTPNEKLVTRIAVPDVPFHGTWTYEISRTSSGSHLRITERVGFGPGFGRYPAYRPSTARTITHYLLDLGGRFGEDVKVFK